MSILYNKVRKISSITLNSQSLFTAVLVNVGAESVFGLASIALSADIYSENFLLLTFEDGGGLAIFENNRNCCEQKYLETDDSLPFYVGSDLLFIEEKGAKYGEQDDEDIGNVIDINFIEICTSIGTIQLKAYNIHNGYYGGFYTDVMELDSFIINEMFLNKLTV